MSDLDENQDDLEPDETEDTSAFKAPFEEFDVRVLEHLTDAKVKIGSITANEFLIEAYLAATMLRNVCGDADAFVADQANTIRQNLLVLATEIAKSPIEFVIAVARSIEDPDEQMRFVTANVTEFIEYESKLAKKGWEDYREYAAGGVG